MWGFLFLLIPNVLLWFEHCHKKIPSNVSRTRWIEVRLGTLKSHKNPADAQSNLECTLNPHCVDVHFFVQLPASSTAPWALTTATLCL